MFLNSQAPFTNGTPAPRANHEIQAAIKEGKSLDSGHIANWPNVIRVAQNLDVIRVLPGHGPAGGKDLLAGQFRCLEELQNAVAAAIQRGDTIDQPVTSKTGKPSATSIQLPESVQCWVSLQHWKLPTQVKDTCEELTPGKPDGEILGGKQPRFTHMQNRLMPLLLLLTALAGVTAAEEVLVTSVAKARFRVKDLWRKPIQKSSEKRPSSLCVRRTASPCRPPPPARSRPAGGAVLLREPSPLCRRSTGRSTRPPGSRP